ncbi:MAG: YcxB family protein [Anaerolineales bacterium]
MEIKFSLAEPDLFALAEFQVEMSVALRKQTRLRRILYPLSFGLLALGALIVADDLLLPIMFGLMAVLSFLLAPALFEWLYRRRLPQVVRQKMSSTSLGYRSLTANESGLQQRAGELYSEVPWSLVQEIAETPNHIFVAIDGVYSVIIPRSEVTAEELNCFIGLLREKID